MEEEQNGTQDGALTQVHTSINGCLASVYVQWRAINTWFSYDVFNFQSGQLSILLKFSFIRCDLLITYGFLISIYLISKFMRCVTKIKMEAPWGSRLVQKISYCSGFCYLKSSCSRRSINFNVTSSRVIIFHFGGKIKDRRFCWTPWPPCNMASPYKAL